MSRNIKMHVIVPIWEDGTSWYRGMGVVGNLARQMPNLDCLFFDRVNWAIAEQCDIVFMQRPCAPEHINIARKLKESEKPVKLWCDWDDNLLDVPLENPQHGLYSNPDLQKAYIELIKVADVITVTTPSLYNFMIKNNNNVHIVPNAINDDRFNIRDPKKLRPRYTKDRKKILWRGANNHDKNLATFTPAISELNRSNDAWQWIFYGAFPFFLRDALRPNSYTFYPFRDVLLYMQTFKEIFPKVNLVCLYNSLFNQSRSNISWMESTYFGESVTVGPNWEQWRVPGCFTYNNMEEFKKHIIDLMRIDNDTTPHVSKAIEYINDNLLLSKVNKKRIEIVNQLMG